MALAHDYLTQRGGAERVALELWAAFPQAPMYTTVFAPGQTFPGFAGRKVTTSWLNRLPGAKRDPRPLLPLLPSAIRSLQVSDVDVLLCSSSGWAHGLRAGRAAKVVYCHNPPRWLYQQEEYLSGRQRARLPLSLLAGRLERFDRLGADSADTYIANSQVVARRIRATYGREAQVINPPRGLEPDGPEERPSGVEPGYLLTVGRPRGYKNTELLIRAMAKRPKDRLVAVGGEPAEDAPNVTVLRNLPDSQLRWLYRNCRALVGISYEDFGLTPPEAMAHGKPVALLRAGGYLETNVEGATGVFIDALEERELLGAIDDLDRIPWDSDAIRLHASQWSPVTFRSRMVDAVEQAARG
ncbi:glycosyltransferase [Modestobacter sp. VKM Ac-2985]|uniref:glycosyltransferase n=1 Tax=Modestobacter sp. VKM Ac-2985 TaxID=3004139 RepID=UPI0022AB9F6B|nr:glycosyltransferase [Modestobacter sp. VKM Ac-2985]MCZ2836036.1 glycosyltransferase [Modestobacter sp. VKM Ac-2985]